jgi:Flp pilus assembly protein TadD
MLALSQPLAQAQDTKLDETIKKGDQLMDKGKFKQAAEVFREAVRINPDSAKAHSRLGASMAAQHDEHEMMGDKKGAENDYETAILEEQTAIKLDPKYASPHLILGQIYANQNKPVEAINEFKTALAIKPNMFTANLDLGIAYLHGGQVDEAIAAFRKAAEIKPDHPVPHMNLGILLDQKGNHKEAINEELEAIRIDKRLHDAHINLGNIYLDAKDLDNAKDSFEKGLALAPGHPNALSGLGWVMAEKGFTKEAIKKQKQAILAYRNFVPAHVRLAMLFAKSGDKANAEFEFKEALRISPKDLVAGTEYAKFLDANGQKAEAKSQFKKVLEVNSRYSPAVQGLAALESAK